MQRRLTLFIVGTVAFVLALAGLGSWLFAEQSVRRATQNQVVTSARALGSSLTNALDLKREVQVQRLLPAITKVARLNGAYLLPVIAHGSPAVDPSSLPRELGITSSELLALAAASSFSGPQPVISGISGSGQAWAAVPAQILVRATVPGAGTSVPTDIRQTEIVVVTRAVGTPSWSASYLILVGALLAFAVLVALALGRRITGPLHRAVAATQRIAAGDLEARVGTSRRDDPEMALLGAAIDTMATSLARLRRTEQQFLLSISHELRTPLTSIRGYAEAIADGTCEQPGAAAGVITHEARRLERLVGDLLDLAKLDAHRFRFELRPVDATELISEVAEEVRPLMDRAHLAFEVELPDEPLPTVVDPDRLDQVLVNLLENAAKFARSRVKMTASANGSNPRVTIDDDGPGIPAHELALVFERHYSVDRGPNAGRTHGSGLGLAIAAELLRAMGATIAVQSPGPPDVVPGSGTRMIVDLPGIEEPSRIAHTSHILSSRARESMEP